MRILERCRAPNELYKFVVHHMKDEENGFERMLRVCWQFNLMALGCIYAEQRKECLKDSEGAHAKQCSHIASDGW